MKNSQTPLEVCLNSYDNMPLMSFLKITKLMVRHLPSHVMSNATNANNNQQTFVVVIVIQLFDHAAKISGSNQELKQKAFLKVLDSLIGRFPYILTLKYTEMQCSLLHLACQRDLKYFMVHLLRQYVLNPNCHYSNNDQQHQP